MLFSFFFLFNGELSEFYEATQANSRRITRRLAQSLFKPFVRGWQSVIVEVGFSKVYQYSEWHVAGL